MGTETFCPAPPARQRDGHVSVLPRLKRETTGAACYSPGDENSFPRMLTSCCTCSFLLFLSEPVPNWGRSVRGGGGGSRQGAGLGHTRKKKGPGNQGPTARRNRRDCRNHSCQLIARLQRPISLPGPGSLSASRVSSSSTLATNRRAETTSCDELFQDSGHMCCNQGRKRITFWIQFPWVPSIYCGCGCAVQRCVLLVCR